jgi:hypothetical protein
MLETFRSILRLSPLPATFFLLIPWLLVVYTPDSATFAVGVGLALATDEPDLHPRMLVTGPAERAALVAKAQIAGSPWRATLDFLVGGSNPWMDGVDEEVAKLPLHVETREQWRAYKFVLGRCLYVYLAAPDNDVSQGSFTEATGPRAICVDAIHEALEKLVVAQPPGGVAPLDSWTQWVPRSDALAMGLYALDAVYDELDPPTRTQLTDELGRLAREVSAVDSLDLQSQQMGPAWRAARHGLWVAWLLFTADPNTAERVRLYYEEITALMPSIEGAYGAGPGYAYARVIGDSWRGVAKVFTADLARFRGYVPGTGDPITDYSDAYTRYINFHRWLFRFGFGADAKPTTFGDTLNWTYGVKLTSPKLWYLRNLEFDGTVNDEMDSYAAFIMRYDPSHLRDSSDAVFALVLSDAGGFDAGGARIPQSQIFAESGAVFRSDSGKVFTSDSQRIGGLSAHLWNFSRCPKDPRTTDNKCETRGDHTHLEVNALHLTAYGKSLLPNVGQCYGNDNNDYCGGDSSDDHHTLRQRRARFANTVTLSPIGRGSAGNHERRHGLGFRYNGTGSIIGFHGNGLDWARGDSGDALRPGTRHYRHLIFVHEDGTIPGYFVVVDEFGGLSSTDEPWVHWHPLRHELQDSIESTEPYRYRAIESWNEKGIPLRGLDIFFASIPAENPVDIPLPAFNSGGAVPRHTLIARYPKVGLRRVLTVLAPWYDDGAGGCGGVHQVDCYGHEHLEAANAYTGLSFQTAAGVRDVAAEFEPTSVHSLYGTEIQGAFAVWRQQRSGYLFYFVKNGRRLLKAGYGFQIVGDETVDVYFRDGEGVVKVSSAPTTAQFFLRDTTTAEVTGGQANVSSCGASCVETTFQDRGVYRVTLR